MAKQQMNDPFFDVMQKAMQDSLIASIKKGDWLRVEYSDRMKLDPAFLRRMHEQIDMDRVLQIVKENVEQKIADNILNAMATEVANDVKSIMSNRELREDIRAVIRSKIRMVESTLKT